MYWLADSDPRSLSAAFQSVSLSSFIVDGACGACFFLGGIPVSFLSMRRGDAGRGGPAPRQHEGRIGRITLSLGPPPIPRVAV
ncbi:hypothetical protein [Mycobacterium tuberculosis]|uniref:hypothetical protein n=1 Tax=Mycobacterium tuberculosis TaxID=1773 RepID=UPI00030DB8ED|nr:hypothetical protein [Mycobacterium tuberculosis]QRX89459.1 hypothetical protein JR349_13265 [Mycobacterium tuberculosis]WBU47207.1 hypothetical protein PAK35_13335 [Mycobacterium tuberculosis]